MIVRCFQCDFSVLVEGDLALFEDQESFPCVRPLCRGRARRVKPLVSDGSRLTNVKASSEEYYRAIHGGGLGEAAPEGKVRAVLLEQRIVALSTRAVGNPERTVIDNITFENGTQMHLAPSNEGACVYYVEAAAS